MSRHLNLSDAHGLTRLALDGARMVTDVVEHAHAAVLGLVGAGMAAGDHPGGTGRFRTGGIPGFIYRSIHAGFDAIDASVSVAVNALSERERARAPLPCAETTAERERMVAILNGVWGDHLLQSGNPLATEMSFVADCAQLLPEPGAIRAAFPEGGKRLAIFAHGLCMNERAWLVDGRDPAVKLARELGYAPLHLRYNSGLRISTNGRKLDEMLEALVTAWPEPVEEIALVGHSMGALVERSAAHYGAANGHAWRGKLRRIIFLTAPHHGSPLERTGHWADDLLSRTPYSAPFRRLGISRSAGITDLRHGNVLDEDWDGYDRFGHHDDKRIPHPLPADVACYAAAVTLGARAGDAKDRLLGDGLVPLQSALGQHREPARCLDFPPERQWVRYQTGHVELLRRPELYEKLREWLA